MKFLLFVFLISISLFAQNKIEPVVLVETNDINLSHIVLGVAQDQKLASIEEGRYTYKIKAEDLLEKLKKLGYPHYQAQSRYVRFVKKSPIDTTKIEDAVAKFYALHYKNIAIQSITILPRGFLESLPEHYTIELHPKNYLSNEGIVSIKSLDNKKLFFDYTVVAYIDIYKAKTAISKETPLSFTNLLKQRVLLDSFKDAPFILASQNSVYQAKYNIKAGSTLTMRDVDALTLVKRGAKVGVKMPSETMDIKFSAEALQDGKLNDIITVLNSNNKKIRVKVVGRDQVEMR